ncbi:MAG: tRNA uridine-5-carboxymethylaminomethyl(34) synthesis GTPase MnmE [Proteobacteria bacterium]|nr:tRNA uridine-5-carboxymethylaminomethyl(34) synthesis GTPase MnmE [Pseudomonadota bacterium]
MNRFVSADTIVALATAPLAAGVAVVRLSGPQALAAAGAVCPALGRDAKPRQMVYGPFVASDGEAIDHGLAVYFKAPNSFTGEDVVELHGHGGRAVVQATLEALLAQHGVRAAEAGEFSRRAFLNGKMDLTAAEGLADLIAAETDAQRKQALRQLDGELGTVFEAWRTRLLHLVAHVEAAIDFPDEELDVLEAAGLKNGLDALVADMQSALSNQMGQRVRDGFQVVIVGVPNAGKSTLTNLLTGKETAIVSPIAGTTRDVVEAHLTLGGYPVILADTAGLRETSDSIEAEGVIRARKRVDAADLVIAVTPAPDWPSVDADVRASLKPDATVVVVSKSDCFHHDLPMAFEDKGHAYPVLGLNLTDPTSLDALLPALTRVIEGTYGSTQSAARLTRDRHRSAVQKAVEHMQRALTLYAAPNPAYSLSDLLAQDLRDAAAALGTVTGRTDTEAVLDVVFSTFCIGK